MPLEIQAQAADNDKHELDITALLFHNNALYSASDDGKLKKWDENLKLLNQVQAHPCSVYSITVGNNSLYSCSNDGTVKSWDLNHLGELATVFHEQQEMYKVYFNEGRLYVGDDAGKVKIFVNEQIVGILEIMHPIVDLLAIGNLVFTARDLYVIISEIDTERKRIATLKSIEGRAPVCTTNGKICFTSRNGRDILVHDASIANEFKYIGQVQSAHELIINALCAVPDDNSVIFSGGWDKIIKRWKVTDDSLTQMVETCPTEMNITAIAAASSNKIFVGGGDGRIVRMDIQ